VRAHDSTPPEWRRAPGAGLAERAATWPLLRPGRAGRGPGPDVREALFLLPSGVPQAGDVEVHLRASDFLRHGHHRDPAHDGVLLHLQELWCKRGGAAAYPLSASHGAQ